MIASYAEADVNVIALIGERGREVREFLEKDLDEEGRRKSVVVVATSNEPALVRFEGSVPGDGHRGTFRDAGKNVLLMMDSLTRFATAQREIGLAVGEPPTTRGYTPSVFFAAANNCSNGRALRNAVRLPVSLPCWSKRMTWMNRWRMRCGRFSMGTLC